MINMEIPISNDGIALIFRLIASGEIKHVRDNQGRYYRVLAEEITNEEYEADKAKEAAEREQSEES